MDTLVNFLLNIGRMGLIQTDRVQVQGNVDCVVVGRQVIACVGLIKMDSLAKCLLFIFCAL